MHDARKRLGGLLAISVIGSALAAACGDSEGNGGMGGMGGAGGSGTVGSGGGGGGDLTPGTGGSDAPATGGATFAGIAGGGLKLDVLNVKVSSKGVATVEFTIADDEDRPLDREGKLTFGAVAPNFILSWLGVVTDDSLPDYGESTQYTAYTLRTKETDAGDEVQSSYDSGGTYETISVGHYRYTLGTKIDITSERESLTHSLGVYATRELGEIRYVATDIETWVPDGSDVETVLDVVTTEACNECHTRLEAHGGSRRGVEMCQLCHTESNSINPESGNTFDFQVMVHKIHRGKDLPSVVAGDPYYFVGFGGRTDDFSDVAYPWDMKDCGKCHQGSQGERWNTRPALKPCTSCHDRTYFEAGPVPEGWTAHTGGVHDDSECVVCHSANSLEPIAKSHTTTITDEDRPVVAAEILGVENTGPGQLPEIGFEVTLDGLPVDILSDVPAERLNRLRLRIWGPTSDVTTAWSETIGDEANAIVPVECDSLFTPPCVESVGEAFVYYAATAIPALATGSYIAGFDGRYAADPIYGNIAFINPTLTFAVTGEKTERRVIVNRESCNSCHGDLGEHGGGYKDPLYCLNCHNTTGGTFEPEEPLAPGESGSVVAINLKDFLHSKHSSVRYPSPLDVCQQCHVEDSYTLPLDAGLLSSTYATVTCPADAATCDEEGMGGAPPTALVSTPVEFGPAASACVSCHSGSDTVAHVQTNTAPNGGEACGTCHGPGKTYDVTVVHGLEP